MRMVNCSQGSPEWLQARLGIPTASEFDKLITPAKWEPTKGTTSRNYAIKLLTERIIGAPLDHVTTAAMQAGHDWEPKARAAYELRAGVDVGICGLCLNDEGTAGASPDFLVGSEGSGEIKYATAPEIHIGRLIDSEGFRQEHFVQVQGQLYITGREWVDLVGYSAGLPMVQVRCYAVPDFQVKLAAALDVFLAGLHLLVERAKSEGWIAPPGPAIVEDQWGWLGITDEDVAGLFEDTGAK